MNHDLSSKSLTNITIIALLSMVIMSSIGYGYLSAFKLWDESQQFFSWVMNLEQLTEIMINHSMPIYPYDLSTVFTLGIITIPISSLVMSVFIVWFLFVLDYEPNIYRHLDGPVLLKNNNAIKHMNRLVKNEGMPGINIHPKAKLSLIRELGNIFIWGMQGSGKSNLIKLLLSQVIARKDKAIIYDIKGEYTELFFDSNAILISPKDQRSAVWDLSKDIYNTGLAEVFSEAVLTSDATKEAFWVDSSRTVLKGVLVGLMSNNKNWKWTNLNDALCLSDDDLHNFLLINYPQASQLIKPNDKTTTSIRSMLAAQLSWIGDIAKNWEDVENTFSISKWLSDNKKTSLLVQGDLKSPAMSSALITALMSITTSFILDRPDTDKDRIWLVLDELGNLNKSQSLEKWLSLGRSKGCRAIAGTQQLSQVSSIYGENDANTILGLFNNIAVFKLAPNGNSAEVASKSLGQRRVESVTKSTNNKGESSNSFQQEMIPIVRSENIIHLPQANLKKGIAGYMLLAGSEAVYRLNWPINTQFSKITTAVVLKPSTKKVTSELSSEGKKTNRLSRRKLS
jgi:hypothetical protein